MGWFKRILPTAAGPGLIVVILLIAGFVVAPHLSAVLLGGGIGTALSIAGLLVALIGMSMATRWAGAIGFALLAAAASRWPVMVGDRLGATSMEWELLVAVGVFCVYLIAIAAAYGVRTAARGDRAAVVEAGEA